MTFFLNNLIQASIHGSIVILAVILLRLLLRNTPKKFICLLWLLAGIRLLMPIEIRSDLSLQPVITLSQEAVWNSSWSAVIPWIWAIVAICFGIYSILSYRNLKNKVVDAVRIRGGWESDRIETAFILGFIKPKIYIPMGMSKGNRKHILEHERTHLDKGDHWIKMIGFLALALHWFNPLVWIAYLLLCRDIEMACDERVVQFMELEERKSYSAALLSCSTNQMHFAASPVAFGEVSVTKRIHSILNYKKPGFWISLLGVVSIFFVAVCLLTNPGQEPGEIPTTQPQIQQESQEENQWLKLCREDLEKALSRDTFCCRIAEASGVGYVNLYKLGDDTLWTLLPLTSMKPEEGRMVLDGHTYAFMDGSWMATEVEDENFWQLLDAYRWESEQASFVKSEADEYGLTSVEFQVRRNGQLENFTCHYREGIGLETIMVKKDGAHGTILSCLYFDDRNPALSQGMNAEETFAEAKLAIMAGSISTEELEEQEEFREWGVLFRVDDDLLSGNGSNVYIGQSEEGRGILRTTGQYWIEKKIDGKWERIPTISEPDWEEIGEIGIPRGTSNWGYLDWSVLYGTLDAGEYRMGKNVRCMDQETNYNKGHVFYSEFTLVETVDSSSPEASAAVERCYSAWEELANRAYIHFKTNAGSTEEYWVNGTNYLRISDFGTENTNPLNNGRMDIYARKDGIGYHQVRENPDVRNSKVTGIALYTVNQTDDSWCTNFRNSAASIYQRSNKTAVFMEDTGIISDEMVRFDLVWRNAGDKEDNHIQMTYSFDSNGNLIRMEQVCLYMESHYTEWVEIYDTSAQEIDAKIQSYIEDPIVETFSWEDAKTKYTDEEFNIREENFINNGGSAIEDCVDAARLALKEYPSLGSYLNLTVFRDEEAGMWKVTIKSYVDYQATYGFRDVYLTDDGTTKLLVYEGPLGHEEPRK